MNRATDEILLNGIRTSNNQLIKQVYDLALPAVISWVKDNSGTEADAQDVFQESLVVIFKKLQKGNFELTCTLKSFIRIVCRNLWLAKIRNKDKKMNVSTPDLEKIKLEDDIIYNIELSEKEQLFYSHLNLLGKDCKTILKKFFEKIPFKTIAAEMQTSESYIKKRKFICKEKLIKSIQSDKKYAELSEI